MLSFLSSPGSRFLVVEVPRSDRRCSSGAPAVPFLEMSWSGVLFAALGSDEEL